MSSRIKIFDKDIKTINYDYNLMCLFSHKFDVPNKIIEK
ncbi:hypothetical protein PHEL85_0222 [Polaribacter sp. Hel1_85]|nr:hypothetical protein PHEL85_0222 [Polaribacter sp. Hel1_85]